MRKLVNEPLIHFLILGAAFFLFFDLARETDQQGTRQIRVTAGQIEQLVAQFSRTWVRSPTEEELAGLIERHVRGEVFYREALSMGLDQDDPYVRNRLGQKLALLLDGLSAEAEPTDAALDSYLKQHAEKFFQPARLSFRQVYLNPDRHPDLEAATAQLLQPLRAGADPAGMSDVTLVGYAFENVTQPEIARQFGADFAASLVALTPGTWVGPVRSGFGTHLILIAEQQPPKQPALAEVRDHVWREWQDQRRREQKERAYRRLRDRYEIVIEPAVRVDLRLAPDYLPRRRASGRGCLMAAAPRLPVRCPARLTRDNDATAAPSRRVAHAPGRVLVHAWRCARVPSRSAGSQAAHAGALGG